MAAVGIVVPVFNGLPWLHETISSIRRQTYTDWRCVLVDDGSLDGSAAVCDEAAGADSRIRAVHQENAGGSAARNAGAAAVGECEFWSFMDADDVWRPNALARLTSAARNPGVIGAHCLAETIGTEGQTLTFGFTDFQRSRTRPGRRRFEPVPVAEPTTLDMALLINRVYPPAVLIARAETYRTAGPWDEKLALQQDGDMVLRLLEHGSLAFVDECLVGYRRHPANVSRDWARNVAAWRAVHVAAFDRLTPSLGRRRLRAWWRQYERLKLAEAVAELPSRRGVARVAANTWRYARGWPSTSRFG